MKKSTKLSEKLKNYSILTGSILAASAAQGQVIYTNANDIQLGGVIPTSYPEAWTHAIDLNNDGKADFNIDLEIFGVDAKHGGFSFTENIDVLNTRNYIGTQTIGYHPFALQFKQGDLISLSANKQAQFGIFSFQSSKSVSPFGWKNVTDKYAGLKFVGADDSIHYAWLRLDVNTKDSIPNIIIKDYAYEATPNKPITAGDGLINGINPVNEQDHFTVFPNPSSGTCFIQVEKPLAGNVLLSVKDESGKELFSSNTEMKGNAIPFDFSEFPSGIYFITLQSKDISLTGKWMKN